MKRILIYLLALFVIFEEWLWDLLADLGQYFSRIFHLEKLDARLINASPTQALFSFAIPIFIVTPFNILAVILLTHGAIIQGLLLEIVIKLVGTLFIARIFRLVKPALLTFEWFQLIHDKVIFLLRRAKELVVETEVYQFSIKLKITIKKKVSEFLNY